jgi:hypothetical protein
MTTDGLDSIRQQARAIGAELRAIGQQPASTEQERIQRHLAARAEACVDTLLAALIDLEDATRDRQT